MGGNAAKRKRALNQKNDSSIYRKAKPIDKKFTVAGDYRKNFLLRLSRFWPKKSIKQILLSGDSKIKNAYLYGVRFAQRSMVWETRNRKQINKNFKRIVLGGLFGLSIGLVGFNVAREVWKKYDFVQPPCIERSKYAEFRQEFEKKHNSALRRMVFEELLEIPSNVNINAISLKDREILREFVPGTNITNWEKIWHETLLEIEGKGYRFEGNIQPNSFANTSFEIVWSQAENNYFHNACKFLIEKKFGYPKAQYIEKSFNDVVSRNSNSWAFQVMGDSFVRQLFNETLNELFRDDYSSRNFNSKMQILEERFDEKIKQNLSFWENETLKVDSELRLNGSDTL